MKDLVLYAIFILCGSMAVPLFASVGIYKLSETSPLYLLLLMPVAASVYPAYRFFVWVAGKLGYEKPQASDSMPVTGWLDEEERQKRKEK